MDACFHPATVAPGKPNTSICNAVWLNTGSDNPCKRSSPEIKRSCTTDKGPSAVNSNMAGPGAPDNTTSTS